MKMTDYIIEEVNTPTVWTNDLNKKCIDIVYQTMKEFFDNKEVERYRLINTILLNNDWCNIGNIEDALQILKEQQYIKQIRKFENNEYKFYYKR